MRVQKMKNKVNCRIASKSRHGLQLIWSPSSQGSAEDKASKKEREKNEWTTKNEFEADDFGK